MHYLMVLNEFPSKAHAFFFVLSSKQACHVSVSHHSSPFSSTRNKTSMMHLSGTTSECALDEVISVQCLPATNLALHYTSCLTL